MDQKRSKFIGSLLGAAIGDALGSRREGTSGFEEILEMGPRYSADTSMMIAATEALIERGSYDYHEMALRLIENYEREPWRKYESGPPRIFRMMRNGRIWQGMLDRELFPGGYFGNGAALRVAPVALLYHDDPRLLREVARHSVSITHSNEMALEGATLHACAVALSVLAEPENIRYMEFLGALKLFTRPGPYSEKLKAIVRFLDAGGAEKDEVVRQLGNGFEAIHSVPTAVYSFLANPDFESAMVFAVSLGGDAATIGAMTGAIAGACHGVEGIPERWRGNVENREYIEELAGRLWEARVQMKQETH